MIVKTAGDVLTRGITAIIEDVASENSKFKAVFKKVAGHPIKILASFIAAPFLIIKIAWMVNNPIRRIIAIIGLLLSLLLSYAAATLLGTLVGALFVASHIGILTGVGFLFGTTLSIYLSVIFSIIEFNSVSFIFLKASSQEVIDYLQEISI